ncbi:hypothetical protein LTR70_008013 [Exophiala xenobiotica]|uniref:Fascin-like protein n=1 Tax=Lithohypha guttulata TaxID=1690604 RepID=A0ABR0KLI1_9EURO|nr:hypothetical protein LTR24_001116 [Lithohypha guttulata]KAK5312758.1 hypothetical protein LTR70_008013 [Exophiala xenobiotica]
MTLNQVDPEPVLEPHDFTAYTAMTPPETIAGDTMDHPEPTKFSSSSVPWPGSTFIIRCATSGHVVTLLNGEITLAAPGRLDSIRWTCVETKGWLGFQNPVSGKFLGHDNNGRLICSADRHLGWENFCARMKPEGGYVLLMTHQERLWHVGVREEQGLEKLAKIGDGASGATVWDFVKV